MAEAKNAQNEYFEKIKNTNPFNPELRLEANKASQKINQLQALSATHQAFIKDLQDNKDLLSKVNGPDAYQQAMDFASFAIEKDKDGNYNFKDKNGNVVSRKQLAEYADNLIEVPVAIYNDLATTAARLAGQPNFEGVKSMLVSKLNTALLDKAYGNDFLFDSLGGTFNPLDKTDAAGGMRIAKYQGKTKQEILDLAPGKTQEEKIENLRKEVVNGYMGAFQESHRLLNPPPAQKPVAATDADKKRAIDNQKNRLLKTQLGAALNGIVEKQKSGKVYPSDLKKALEAIPNIRVAKDEQTGELMIINTNAPKQDPIVLEDINTPGWGTRAIKAVEDALNLSIEYRQGTKIPPHLRNN